jgi:hypothetical protein
MQDTPAKGEGYTSSGLGAGLIDKSILGESPDLSITKRGRPLTCSKISPMYRPTIPRQERIIPPSIKISTTMLVHPSMLE